ncbi:MAG: Lrp/AsnC family transcriptional regulator [Candidatus Hydrothermarchaeales archaeon]
MKIPNLSEKESRTIIEFLKNPNITDKELASVLEVKSSNGARRYRKKLEEKGILETKVKISPEKFGFPIRFMVLASGSSKKESLEILKIHCLRAQKYLEDVGEVIIIPMGDGHVLIQNILTMEDLKGLIMGYATSLKTYHTYVDLYLPDAFPNIVTESKVIHSSTIEDFLINEKELNDYFVFLPPPDDFGPALKKSILLNKDLRDD